MSDAQDDDSPPPSEARVCPVARFPSLAPETPWRTSDHEPTDHKALVEHSHTSTTFAGIH
jgi:hypothetical protein